MTIDLEKYEVEVKGKRIDLTSTEFKILQLFVSKKGWVFSREKILSTSGGMTRWSLTEPLMSISNISGKTRHGCKVYSEYARGRLQTRGMKTSLFSKAFGGYLVIICTLLLFIPIISFKLIRTNYVNTLTDNLKNIAITTSPHVVDYLENRRFQELDVFLKDLRGKINARVTVINRDGVVLADTEKDPSVMESHKIRPEVVDALSGGVGKSTRFSITLEETMLYVALPVEKDSRILGVIRMSIPLKQVNRLLRDLQLRILIGIATVTLLQ